jgi:hypothetical protein
MFGYTANSRLLGNRDFSISFYYLDAVCYTFPDGIATR